MRSFLNLSSLKPAFQLVEYEPPVFSHLVTGDFSLAHELIYGGFRDFKVDRHIGDGEDALA